MKPLRKFAFLLLFLALTVSAYAQNPETARLENKTAVQTSLVAQDFKLKSKLMAREMPYRVVLPKNYEVDKTRKFPVLYLLHGLTGHFDNWTDKTKLKDYATGYDYIIVTPEGNNGWYTDSATVPNDKYESYIIQELVPEIDASFRTLADREHRLIAGLSMGGYGALKFGLKYPEKFVLAGSFSGALPVAGWTSKFFESGAMKGAIPDSIKSVYGADDSPTRADNDIFKIVREITPEKAKSLPFIYVDCGTEDFLIQGNREFANLLLEKKIPHEYRQLPGVHNWAFWDSSVKEFLEVSRKFVK